MNEKILIISQNSKDLELLNNILKSDRYAVTHSSFGDGTEKYILQNGFPLVLADYDLIRDKVNVFYELQKGPSKAYPIFYTDDIGAEEATQILQKGVYTIIPRPLLAERNEAIVGGLENRKAYIEILGMMDELIEVNERLETEKENLRERNQELRFINLLSQEISYDPNWDRILNRMIDIGLKETPDYSLFGILYRIGPGWDLALHLAEGASIIKEKALSFIMIDLDNFKSIKDSMGHQAGDYVLRELAGILKGSIRQPDIVARYGGDEFAILLPETKTDEVDAIMGRVLHNIETHTFEWGSGKVKARMSYGIANTDDLHENDDVEVLVRLADLRLYTSKKS